MIVGVRHQGDRVRCQLIDQLHAYAARSACNGDGQWFRLPVGWVNHDEFSVSWNDQSIYPVPIVPVCQRRNHER